MLNEEANGDSTVFTPPPFLKKAFDEFAFKYQQFKRMRTVNFKPNLGSVHLTLDFQNGSFKFRVTPFQAAVISLFNGEKTYSAEQLAKELEVSAEDVRKRGVAFWVCKGVLREQKVFRQLGSSNYRSTALLSNSDIDIVYSSVDVLELKGPEVIEAHEVAHSASQEPQLIRIQ